MPGLQPTIISRDVLELALANIEGVISTGVELLSSEDIPNEIMTSASSSAILNRDDIPLAMDVTPVATLTIAPVSPYAAPSHTPVRLSLPPTITGRGLLDEVDLGDVEGIVSGALNVLAPHDAPNYPTKTALSTPSSTLSARTPDDDDLLGDFDSLIDALDYPAILAAPTAMDPTATVKDMMPAASIVARVLEQDDGLIGDFDAIPKGWTMAGVTSFPTATWVRAPREYDDGQIGDNNGLIDPLAPLAAATTATSSDTTITMTATTDVLSQMATAVAVPSVVSTTTSLRFGASETPSPSTADVVSPATPSVLVAPCMTVSLS
jgi:hypothetical protein